MRVCSRHPGPTGALDQQGRRGLSPPSGVRHRRVPGRAPSDASSQVAASLNRAGIYNEIRKYISALPPLPLPYRPPSPVSLAVSFAFISVPQKQKKNPILHLVLVSKQKTE